MAELPIAAAEPRSYDPEYFAPLFAIEGRHFWFRTRNRLITALVRRLTRDLPAGYRVLEVGCGTGVVLQALKAACDRGMIVGMDLFIEGLHLARHRTGCALVQGDMHAPPFGERFELIGLFDVLEHLPDDGRVLRDLHAMLAPGGALLLTVPARASLWSYFDEAAHHCRRYEAADLEHTLRDAGFTVEYLTPMMAALFPLIWLGRRVARFQTRGNMEQPDVDAMAMRELRIVPLANGVLTWILAWETRLIGRGKRLWMGTSLLAVARKTVHDDKD